MKVVVSISLLGIVALCNAQQIAAHYQATLIFSGNARFESMDDAGNILYRDGELRYLKNDGSLYSFPSIPGTNSFVINGALNGNGEMLLLVRQQSGGDAYIRRFDFSTQTYSEPYLEPFNVGLEGPMHYTNDHQYTLYGKDNLVNVNAIYGSSQTNADYITSPSGEEQSYVDLVEGGWMASIGQTTGSDSQLYYNGHHVRTIRREGAYSKISGPNSRGEFGFTKYTRSGSDYISSAYVRDSNNATLYSIPDNDRNNYASFYTDTGIVGVRSRPDSLGLVPGKGYLWSAMTGTVDLTPITSGLPAGSKVSTIFKMNRSGQMVVVAATSDAYLGFYRLDPVPEPASFLALGVGLAALTRRRVSKSSAQSNS